jgi:hypothetical protein
LKIFLILSILSWSKDLRLELIISFFELVLIVSPSNYKVQVVAGGATLLTQSNTPTKWADIIEMHGELRATSRLELNISSDPALDDELVIGSITANPLNFL